jgi:hypothetical protein
VKPYGFKDFWCPVYYKNPHRTEQAIGVHRTARSIRRAQHPGAHGTRSPAPPRSQSIPARSKSTGSRFYRPAICSRPVTASASTSPASICRAGSPARMTSNMLRIISAAARPWCTASITTSSIRAIWCCRSSRSAEVRGAALSETKLTPCGRDRFIPVRKSDILDALIEQGAFVGNEACDKFRRLCEMLASIYITKSSSTFTDSRHG